MLGLGLSFILGGSLSPYSDTAISFRRRVNADGGVIEGLACLDRAISSLPQINENRKIFELYQARVISDGGTTEGFSCVVDALDSFPQSDTGRVIYDAYSVRVLADSGTLEGRNCTIAKINELN